MLNIEIPPSAPVTKEEREKWLKKAEYGGKTRRLIDHLNSEEEKAFRLSCFDNQDCKDCPLNGLSACDEICRDKASLMAEIIEQRERAEQAEAERDLLANKMADISDKMNGWNPPPTFCHACNICPANSDDEMEGVTCEVRIHEWAQKEAGRKDAD